MDKAIFGAGCMRVFAEAQPDIKNAANVFTLAVGGEASPPGCGLPCLPTLAYIGPESQHLNVGLH